MCEVQHLIWAGIEVGIETEKYPSHEWVNWIVKICTLRLRRFLISLARSGGVGAVPVQSCNRRV